MSSIFGCCFKAPELLVGSGPLVAMAEREAGEDGRTGLYGELTALMCWSAVAHCAYKAGSITEKKCENIKNLDVANSEAYVTTADTEVKDASVMSDVPAGSFLGFFNGDTIVHGMLALGKGRAAGNKNSCIGIGAHLGWQILDLAADLHWHAAGGFWDGWRRLTIHYRPLDAYQQ